jgi:hypothetical protein
MADKKISQLTAASTPLAGTEVLPIVQSGSTVKATISNVLAPIQVTTTRAGINTAPSFSFHVLGSGEFGGMLAQSSVAGATSFTVQQGVTGVSNSGVTIRNADSAYDWLRFTATGGDVSVQTGNLVIGTAGKGIDFSAATHAAGMTSELLNDYEEGTWTPTVSGANLSLSSISSAYYTIIGRQVTVYCYITVANSGAPSTALVLGGLPKTCLGYGPAFRFYGPNKFTGDCYVSVGTATIVETNILATGSSAIMVTATYFF